MNFDLTINTVAFRLGEDFDPANLKSASCSKLDFSSRRMFRLSPNQDTWWAMNCIVRGFGGQILAFANLESEGGPRFMCGSTAYLLYEGYRLRRISFQVIGSEVMAKRQFNCFKDLARGKLGNPVEEDVPVLTWEDQDALLIAELDAGGSNAYFHWIAKEEKTGLGAVFPGEGRRDKGTDAKHR